MTTVELHTVSRQRPDGSIRKVWMLRWYGADGKRYGETIGDVDGADKIKKRDAQVKQRAKQSKFDEHTAPIDKPKKMTLAQFEVHHHDSIKGDVKPATLDCYQVVFKRTIDALGGELCIGAINASHVGRVKSAMLASGLSSTTRRSTLIALRCIFNRAVAWGFIAKNPFAKDGKLPEAQAKTKRIYEPREELVMLRAAPSRWWRAFIKLAITSGLRLQEIQHLQWSDIDLKNKQVVVQAKRAESFTIDGVTYSTLEWSPKSHQARCVPIPASTLRMLTKLRKATKGPYVFLTLDRIAQVNGRQPRSSKRARVDVMNNTLRDFRRIQRTAQAIIVQWCKRHKVQDVPGWKAGTFHDLRKTFGTRMADVVPMHVLQKWMGHKEITTTADFYLKAGDHHADVARAAMERKPLLRLAS